MSHPVRSPGVAARSAAHIILIIVLTGSLGGASAAYGHEIGTTRVSATFADPRRFDIEIVTDAASLAEKLSRGRALSECAPGAPTMPSCLGELLNDARDALLQRITISFDGSRVRPAVVLDVSPSPNVALPAVATIRLTGEVPAGAREFTWTYAWTFSSYALTVRTGAAPTTQWLEGEQRSAQIALAPMAPSARDRLAAALRYVGFGFTHVAPKGLDHMLFVMGIFILSGRLRPAVWQASAFALAHAIALGLNLYGVISPPALPVEPLIAGSIAYVAIENVFGTGMGLRRTALAFGCGLLHGTRCASELERFGSPRPEGMAALVSFDLGVEAGALAVIGVAFLLVGWYWCDRDWYRPRIAVPASALIACAGVYWTIQRLPI